MLNHAGSPILGAIFFSLGVYFLLSRYLRFYLSVNRIAAQFGLSDTPKYFYTLGFQGDGFDVKSEKEQAHYPLDRITRACFMEGDRIAYLYLTASSAFLLPYEGFTQGSPGDLKALLLEACGEKTVEIKAK